MKPPQLFAQRARRSAMLMADIQFAVDFHAAPVDVGQAVRRKHVVDACWARVDLNAIVRAGSVENIPAGKCVSQTV